MEEVKEEVSEHTKMIFDLGQRTALRMLISDIRFHEYKNLSQVIGAIENHLEELEDE